MSREFKGKIFTAYNAAERPFSHQLYAVLADGDIDRSNAFDIHFETDKVFKNDDWEIEDNMLIRDNELRGNTNFCKYEQ